MTTLPTIARIWVTAPHETDGYCVEILSKLTPKAKDFTVTEDSAWRPTVKECHEWANGMGVQDVIEC